MRTLVRGARAIGRVLWRSKQLDADMQEEMRFHVQMEAERLTRVEGLHPEEARRQAYVRFGGVEKYKEEGREARGLSWLDGASIDARLGLRMLVKHRWLTLVGGFAMTVAIAIGAITFEVISDLLNPALPFPDGQRVVALKYVATKAGRADDRVLHAFSAWRDRVTTLEYVGAFRDAQHNLVAPNTPPEPIHVAEITARRSTSRRRHRCSAATCSRRTRRWAPLPSWSSATTRGACASTRIRRSSAAAYVSWHVVQIELTGPTIAVEQFVVADMVVANMNVSDQGAFDRQHVRNRLLALMARLREEPGVTAVTFSSGVPGFGPDRRIEFPGTAQQRDGRTPEVATFQIDVDLLKTYGARILAGRDFDARDTGSSTAVIVNRTFASDVLGVAAHAALGSRFRYTTRTDWFDIVGVVDDFPGFPRDPGSETEPTVYQPAAPGDFHPPVVSMRFSGPIPEGISERLRGVGAQVDPALQLRRVVPLSDFYDELRSVWRTIAWAAGIITISVLLLSAAGMHALMAFTIAQRTREIGIRSALGAQPRQLLMGLFGRAMRQLLIGLLVGSLASVGVFAAAGIGVRPAAAMLLTVATVMALVASFAALGPARRSLRLPAVEALRVEG